MGQYPRSFSTTRSLPTHSLFIRSLLTCLLFVSSCVALNASLVVANKVIAPDGYSRDSITVNGQYPGPPLTAVKGERFQINVTDELRDEYMNTSTTIHWHGIYQNRSNEMDGTAMVTQCPITSNHSFLYDFTPSNQSGSFWYHSHFGLQYCEGLRGPLVIYDPDDPYLDTYDVDDTSTIITLTDWYHVNAYNIETNTLPYATLFNGRGRSEYGPPVPLSVTNVLPGKRYRIRLMSMACRTNYVFSIDSHTFTVIEADGASTEPLVVDSIQILAGQRYSFILEANQTVDNYWIRANPNYDSTYTGGVNSAILRYKGAPERDPPYRSWTTSNLLLEQNLHALEDPAAPGLPDSDGADISLNLVNVWDDNSRYLINGYTYIPPSTPILLQILKGQLDPYKLQPEGSIYALPANKTIQLSIPGGQPEGPHPFHMHGHAFSVVRSAGNDSYNYDNPVRRDTTSNGVESTDNVTIRFRTDNVGPWMFHCHIDPHLEQGMAVVFVEDIRNVSSLDVPSSWKKLCPAYNTSAEN